MWIVRSLKLEKSHHVDEELQGNIEEDSIRKKEDDHCV